MDKSAVIFAGISIVCILLMVGSLVGGDADTDFGLDADIDTEGFDITGLLSWLSLKRLGPGMIVGGAVGFVVDRSAATLVIAIIAGIASGIAMAIIGDKFIVTPLTSREHTDSYSIHDLVLKYGKVTVAIPAGQIGQVSVNNQAGATVSYTAVSSNGEAISAGTSVIIVDVQHGDTDRLIVTPDPINAF